MNEILENNKLIAEFMELKYSQKYETYDEYWGIWETHDDGIWFINLASEEQDWGYCKINGIIYDKYHYGLNYNKSWDWLMPVIDKIELIKNDYHGHFGVHIYSNSCTIQGTNFRCDNIVNPPIYFANWVLDDKIITTWKAVVEFIKWYNKEVIT